MTTARTSIYLHDYWIERYRRELPAQDTLSGLTLLALEARLDHPELWSRLVAEVKGPATTGGAET